MGAEHGNALQPDSWKMAAPFGAGQRAAGRTPGVARNLQKRPGEHGDLAKKMERFLQEKWDHQDDFVKEHEFF